MSRTASSPAPQNASWEDPVRAQAPAVAVAPAGADPDHHLWRNGRRWWIAFTVHRGHVQERVRFSLGTRDLAVARRRRDEILRLFAAAPDLNISLRFAPRRVGTPRRRQRGKGRAA